MIQDFVRLIPRSLTNTSGKVFYSGRRAFESQSGLYVLGVNPGGDPQEQSDETVSSHTNSVLHSEPENWSAYRDESWGGRPPGTVRMQPRMLHLFRRLGVDPGEVPASNVVFVRSGRKANLKGDFSQLAMECWPFHQAVVQQLGVRVILCLGQDPGDWVRDRFLTQTQVDEFIEDNNRGWRSRSYENASGLTVVVATHPSRVDWTAPATDPTQLVERALRRRRTRSR